MKKSKNKQALSSFSVIVKTLKYLLPQAWSYKKGYFFLSGFNTVLSIIQPFINITFYPLIINELTKGSNADLKLTIIYAVAMVCLEMLLHNIKDAVGLTLQKYDDLFQAWTTQINSRKSMEMDFCLTEDKQALDQREKATQGMSWYSGGIHGITTAFFEIIGNAIRLVSLVAVIATKAPILIFILITLVLISALVQKKLNRIQFENYKELSKVNRIFGYFLFEIVTFQFAKDFRLYNAKTMLNEKISKCVNDLVSKWKKQSKDTNPCFHITNLISAFQRVITTFYLGFLALRRVIQLGTLQQLFTATSYLDSSLQGMIRNYQEIENRCNYAYEFVKFMEYPSAMEKGDKHPSLNNHSIEFKHVSFCYPGSNVQVLKDISIKINSGEHLSIVGLNGAGKTTFIKLLCRLYDVTSGEILLDNINIKEYSDTEYKKLFSVVFQDFKLFAFSIEENITIGKENENLLTLLSEVGMDKKIESLSKKEKTNLFRSFDEDGIELSGGEQQKLAIARALYKNAPIVILDEPTAALDPIAENEIYKQFNSLIGGKTAFYISHRLSSCQFCDNIALFSDGVIKEYGTHSELLKIPNGLYAKMFEAQAQYYK